ncbi:MAG TPA: DNA translocase FtsK 4TM domain-containing protein, partial [Vicinamibacteria bacterium]|nr:DNA translocase FtsK 4TM domain-containing protein [Vicinamibacteria bacterium]
MAETRSTRLAEFLGVLSFALGLMLLISLATYNPHDPAPFFKSGAPGPARNFIGPAGAFLAELLVPQLFGLGAALIPLVLAIFGWALFWCRPVVAPYTKAAGLALLLLSSSTLMTLSVGVVTLRGEGIRAGGAAGEFLTALLISNFNRPGAFIVVITALVVSLILSTQFSFASLLQSLGSIFSARIQALRTAWAHFREARRKERMRREVIRKHTQKEQASESVPRVRRVKTAEDKPEPELPPEPRKAAALKQQPLPFDDVQEGPEAREADPPPARPLPAPPKGAYALPPAALLDELRSEVGVEKGRLFEKAKILQSKCGEFGVLGNVVEIHPGPVVT